MARLIFLLLLLVPSICFGWTFSADFESGTLGQPAEGTSGITEANENGSPYNIYNNTRAYGGTQSMRTYFVQGSTGSPGVAAATGGHIGYPSTVTEGDEIWGRYYVYIPADFNWNNYDGEASHHVKMFRIVHLPDGYISIFHGYLENCIRLSNELDGQGNHERSTTADVTAGAWNCLEIYVKLSATAGQGIVRIWKDGVLIREETNYKTMNSSSDTSGETLVWTYWNGAHPVNQYAWVDDIEITTDRPTNQDAAGNYMIGPTDWGGGGDTTDPSVSISTADPSSIETDSLSISGTASDAVGVSGCKYRMGAAPDASHGTALTGTTSWSGTATGFASGANTLYVGCYDAAGNYGSDSITVNYGTADSLITGTMTGTFH